MYYLLKLKVSYSHYVIQFHYVKRHVQNTTGCLLELFIMVDYFDGNCKWKSLRVIDLLDF